MSEADLLRKSADQTDPSGRSPVPHLEAWERAKAEGSRAGELMSAPAVCARPEWSVVEAARLMEAHHIKRRPVVDATDRLLGIVSRGDLLRIFLRRDDAIRDEITEAGERLHVGVSHRADGGDAESRGRGHVAGAGEAGHRTEPGGLEPGLRAVRAPQGEVHDGPPVRPARHP
ncbi:CBS domain-containing protein [Streptomyces afghaniensis]|nr:CBS domain-containing protein [Streptomyces afghaniensis]